MHILWAVKDEPYILRVLGVYETKEEVAIVMELCDGDMTTLMRKCRTEAQAAQLFLQAMQGVMRCHSLGIIHRDIKPMNFLVAQDGTLRLSDFGLAVHAADLSRQGTYRELGVAKGSGMYVAPECYSNHFSFQSDIWACGILLHVLLTGLEPFSSIEQVHTLPFDDFLMAASCSEISVDLVRRMLEKNPAHRLDDSGVLDHEWTKSQHADIPRDDLLMRRLSQYGDLEKMRRGLLTLVSLSLRPDQIVSAAQWFRGFDEDRSQKISLTELSDSFSRRGVPKDRIDRLMEGLDLDGDNTIDFDEFIAAAVSHSLLQQEDVLRATFRTLDKNRDGKISREEFAEGLGFLNLTPEEMDGFIAKYQDSNGEVGYKEFVQMTKFAHEAR